MASFYLRRNSFFILSLLFSIYTTTVVSLVKKHKKGICTRVCGDYIKWSYHADCTHAGPTQWASMKDGKGVKKYPYCDPTIAGNQSPINIDCSTSISDIVGKISWFNETKKFKVLNNGHTIQANYDDTSATLTTTTNLPYVLEDASSSRTSLPSSVHNSTVTYNVAQFHLHWPKIKNSNDEDEAVNIGGSEHSINGKFSSMELHIVHYNSKFSSLAEAIDNDGTGNLFVIGILFNINDDSESHNPTLERFLKAFGPTKTTGGKKPADGNKVVALDISKFLPPTKKSKSNKSDDFDNYFTYRGSLTTPPCLHNPKMPIVTWLVAKQNMSISSKQLQFLKTNIYTDDIEQKTLISKYGNVRPIQCLGKRNIYYIDNDDTRIPKRCVRPTNGLCMETENSDKLLCEGTIFWYTTAGVVVILLIIFMSAALMLSLAYLYLYKNKSCPSCLKHMKNKIFGRNERLVSNVDSDLLHNSSFTDSLGKRAGVDNGDYEYSVL
jgi:carbonic anhydrase 2